LWLLQADIKDGIAFRGCSRRIDTRFVVLQRAASIGPVTVRASLSAISCYCSGKWATSRGYESAMSPEYQSEPTTWLRRHSEMRNASRAEDDKLEPALVDCRRSIKQRIGAVNRHLNDRPYAYLPPVQCDNFAL